MTPPVDVAFAAAAMVALAAVLFALERAVPLRARRAPLPGRLAVNLIVSALAIGAALALVAPVVDATAQAALQRRFGLLELRPLPAPLAFVAGLLLLDATFYLWHLANHRVPLLWRFHVVHHIDPDLDVSTAFRFHFGEVALSAGFRFAQVLLIGAPLSAIAVYELLFQANTLFHHSNVRLPLRVERLLSRVLVTPRMHGIHHSMVRSENLSNFSVVFPWWDRLMRTLRLNVPQPAVTIGIPAYGSDDNTVRLLLALPFRSQRDAWRRRDGTTATREVRGVAVPPAHLLA